MVEGEVRRRLKPVPVYNDRPVIVDNYRPPGLILDPSKPYLRKEILADIGQNLAELKDIKTGEVFDERSAEIEVEKSVAAVVDKPTVAIEKPVAANINDDKIPVAQIQVAKAGTGTVADIGKVDTNVEKVIVPTTVPKIEFKLANTAGTVIAKVDDKKVDDKKVEDKKKTKVKRYMNDEEQVLISPELKRLQRKAEMEEYEKQKQFEENMRKSLQLSEDNKEKLKSLEQKFEKDRTEIKNEIGSRVGELGNRFGELGNKFGTVESKLKETCDGIDCIKKDLKRFELTECPECNKIVVPARSSYCPECGSKIQKWYDDTGNEIKTWKPNWKK